jgi:hypothetical protein
MTRLCICFVFSALTLLSGCAAVKNEPLQAASLVFQGVQFMISRTVPEKITVHTTGTGQTREEAVNNALVSAMQQGVGVLVVSDTQVIGDRVSSDIVSQYSSAIVRSYKVQGCTDTERVRCDVEVIVSPWTFYQALRSSPGVTQIDGQSLYAQHLSQQHTLQQRKKLTEYFLSKIRTHGLEAVLLEFKVEPSPTREVQVHLKYKVQYKKDFKRELISFLQRVERDTGGGTDWNGRRQEPNMSRHPRTAVLQWGPTGLNENRVYIHTYDDAFFSMIRKYRVEMPLYVSIPELSFCDRIELGDSYGKGFYGDIFQVDWYDLRRSVTFRLEPKKLSDVRQISLSFGCLS